MSAPEERDPATATATGTADLSLWPRGNARLAGEIVEIAGDDGARLSLRDIIGIAVLPPRAGRLCVTLRYREESRKHERSFWIERRHEAALRELVRAIEAAKREV